MRRLSWPVGGGGLGGLTMSEDGGFDEVEESLRAAASCACNWSMVRWRTSSCVRSVSSCARWVSNCACWTSSCACNRRQFGQVGVASAPMAGYFTSLRIGDNTPVNRYGAADTLRFINQFTTGYGDYTSEREALFEQDTLDRIISEI